MIKASVLAAFAASCLLVAGATLAQAGEGTEQKDMRTANPNAGSPAMAPAPMMKKHMSKKAHMHKAM